MLVRYVFYIFVFLFFFKQKTAYEMRISDWSSDVCSSDLPAVDDRAAEEFGIEQRSCTDLAADWWATPAIDTSQPGPARSAERSEERRVGKECVSTCRSRWSPYH